MTPNKILSDFLTQLQVPHTEKYTDRRFEGMAFKTLFGMQRVLEDYGVKTQGIKLGDKREVQKLPVPFIAPLPHGNVIVTSVGDNVDYLSQGVVERVSLDLFLSKWGGVALLAFPDADAKEPDYGLHCRLDFFDSAKVWILLAVAVFLFAYLFISNGLYSHISAIALIVLDLLGLGASYFLVLKSLKIKSHAADKVCGAIEKGGCDDVLATKASKFFGLFGWSEGGFASFSVSLLCLLIFPRWECYLAALNLCCLPFSFWSVWYQKSRAKAWCTLCLAVQAILWLSFGCYLWGDAYHGIFPIKIELFVLGASYLGALLGINRILPKFDKSEYNEA